MPLFSRDLEALLQKYIDTLGVEGRHRLRALLKNESVDTRYELLMSVRGVKVSTWTGLHNGAVTNDLKSIRYMLGGFSFNQKYDVVKIQDSDECTALHIAASLGHTSIINSLFGNLPEDRIYYLLKMRNRNGDTPFHVAATSNKVEAVQAIISSVPSPLLKQLLSIMNKKGQIVKDIRPELYNKLPALISQGNVGLVLIYFLSFVNSLGRR